MHANMHSHYAPLWLQLSHICAVLFIFSCTGMSKTKYFNLFSKGRLIKCMRWNHFRAWSECLVCVIVYHSRGFILLFVIFWKECSCNYGPGEALLCSAAQCCFSFKYSIKKREIPSLFSTFFHVKLKNSPFLSVFEQFLHHDWVQLWSIK